MPRQDGDSPSRKKTPKKIGGGFGGPGFGSAPKPKPPAKPRTDLISLIFGPGRNAAPGTRPTTPPTDPSRGTRAGLPPAALQSMLQASFNLPPALTPLVNSFIDEGIGIGLTGSDLSNFVYARTLKSPEFRTLYPGIFRRDGTLLLSVPEYEQRQEALASIASQHGFTLSREQLGSQINRQRDPEEFAVVAQAVQRVQSNPRVFESLQAIIGGINERRALRGLTPLAQISNVTDAVGFVLGQSDKAVYDAYEAAEVLTAAASSGVQLSDARALQIARSTAGLLAPAQAEESFQRISDRLRLSGVELGTFGISQRDLEVLEGFGSPSGEDRGLIAQRASQALAQHQAQATRRVVQPRAEISPAGPTVGRTEEVRATF